MVAVSRSRGPTTAYGVAAGELVDADLGPGRREVEDPAHDIRSGAERVAEEFAASQVHLRKQLEALSPIELASRRADLERRLDPETQRSPEAERLQRLEQRIATGKERIAALRQDEQQLTSQHRPDREKAVQRWSSIRHSEQMLNRLEIERDDLAKTITVPPTARTVPTMRDRLELSLVEEQMTRL